MKLNLKDKIQILINNFKDLPADRKLSIGMLIFAGLIFVVGTIYIIGSTVLNIDKKNEMAAYAEFRDQIEEYRDAIDSNLQDYSFENLNTDIEVVNSNFDNYKDILGMNHTQLNEYEPYEPEGGELDPPMSSPITATPTATGEDEEQVPSEYQNQLDLLKDVITNQKDYLDLREKGFQEAKDISNSLEFQINQDISDYTTKLTKIENSLNNIQDVNASDTLSKAHLDLFDLNRDLTELNSKHREKIIESLHKQYLENHKKTINDLSTDILENEDKLNEELFEDFMEELDSIKNLLTKLDEEYSESVWARFEENLKQLDEELDNISTSLNNKINS
ncbi:hypothetical protein GF362_06090 [Candidatus Dojkabacteria bacterium]|nr:hypothetical protein [Candidatus Dojkabacteria bacterium]